MNKVSQKFDTTDKSIRASLISELKVKFKEYSSPTAIIPELCLPIGSSRIDIAVINGVMHGYELKSDMDNLTRLYNQIYSYNLIFDKLTLVVGKKHLIEALKLIPQWWGIIVAKPKLEGSSATLVEVRKALDNPQQDMFALVSLLWKDEALEILDLANRMHKQSYKSKVGILKSIVDTFNKDELRELVRKSLINRYSKTNWRSAEGLMLSDG